MVLILDITPDIIIGCDSQLNLLMNNKLKDGEFICFVWQPMELSMKKTIEAIISVLRSIFATCSRACNYKIEDVIFIYKIDFDCTDGDRFYTVANYKR